MSTERWSRAAITALFERPFNDLLDQAHQVHRSQFDPNQVQTCKILSIKTGACPEDCKYCSQSGHYKTDINKHKLLDKQLVLGEAKKAKKLGTTRFCMGAAWRSIPDKSMPELIDLIKAVKDMGLETCMTLGMLNESQAQTLKAAGLDYYNHNLDTSPEYYPEIITTRTYQERLDTLALVRDQGIKVCCGGILGLGETRDDRIGLIHQLANLPQYPESVPINKLIPIPGTPLGDKPPVDTFEFVRTIAVARITMPKAYVRLSAGRDQMSEECQALCFFAGANSIFYGDELLTTANASVQRDHALFDKLGIEPMGPYEDSLRENNNTVTPDHAAAV